jgi:hypothetical protein
MNYASPRQRGEEAMRSIRAAGQHTAGLQLDQQLARRKPVPDIPENLQDCCLGVSAASKLDSLTVTALVTLAISEHESRFRLR